MMRLHAELRRCQRVSPTRVAAASVNGPFISSGGTSAVRTLRTSAPVDRSTTPPVKTAAAPFRKWGQCASCRPLLIRKWWLLAALPAHPVAARVEERLLGYL